MVTSDSRDQMMEALLRLLLPWKHRFRLGCGLWTGGCMASHPQLLRRLTRGRCGKFCKDDALSGVWVAVRASVVDLLANGFSGAPSCLSGVEVAVECIHAATMMSNRRSFVEDSVSASPTISLVKIVVKVGSVSCCRVWPTVGM
jgi:hypothetical protein